MREIISDIWQKGKQAWWPSGLIFCLALFSFACGRLSVFDDQKPPMQIEHAALISCTEASDTVKTGPYVASVSGTKYYPTGCSSAKQIKAENRVYFDSPGEAEEMGYTRASQCASK